MSGSLPILVFDGDCGFCRKCVDLLARLSARVHACAYQQLDHDAAARELARRYGLADSDFSQAAFLLDSSRSFRGHLAFNEILRRSGGPWRRLAQILSWPPIDWIEARIYVFVAHNRSPISRLIGTNTYLLDSRKDQNP
jgi:predicted DCC family thiol-disulfide oxidoreductase YuxK